MTAKPDPPSSANSEPLTGSRTTGSSGSADTQASPPSSASTSVSSPQNSSTASTSRRKPRISLFIATACGLGYLPKAPGTWGSLLAVGLAWANIWAANVNLRFVPPPGNGSWTDRAWSFVGNQLGLAILVSLVGIWASHRAARYLGQKDPQNIVIDEVSGQSIAFLGLLTAGPIPHYWKYLALGFILFRLFDIWKPFPARQAESLPGGWGIMADDWMAGIYAGLGLWLARALGM